MFKKMKLFIFIVISQLALFTFNKASGQEVQTIDDYNNLLPNWGVSWTPGSEAANGYYPSFYTGFVMRSEFPDRIHVHVARGNQVRVSVILDDQTIKDYSYDLLKRSEIYEKINLRFNMHPSGAQFLPQLKYFQQIVHSHMYDIRKTADDYKSGILTKEGLYAKNLELLSKLNPGRIYKIHLNLKNEFLRWKQSLIEKTSGVTTLSSYFEDPIHLVWALNTLVWGRVNYIDTPTAEIKSQLLKTAELALTHANENEFILSALQLFKMITQNKYQFQIVNSDGAFTKAIDCETSENCYLNYPEFTAIYPIGSKAEKTHDEFGNSINQFATPGLWKFLNYPGREVDNIRSETYYGYIPKMDFEGVGNGFHNPAVRFSEPSLSLKQALHIDPAHDTLWAVKRGGVSHGCLRLPAGHAWELRHIFPVENEKMIEIPFFGNNSTDFDIYDINGDGRLSVMGVQYFISYGLQGTDGLAQREGTHFEINNSRKLDFYNDLYGATKVFSLVQNQYLFLNPSASIPSFLDARHNEVQTRIKLQGEIPLYEQNYEREKIQFYGLGGEIEGETKLLVRLMGRIRGCAPDSSKKSCGEEAFANEAKSLLTH